MPVRPFIGQDDVVSPQLFAERLQEDDIRISVDATVLEQNIWSPCVTKRRHPFHALSKYLYHRHGRIPARARHSVEVVRLRLLTSLSVSTVSLYNRPNN